MEKLAMGREATGIAMEKNIGIKANLYYDIQSYSRGAWQGCHDIRDY